MLHIMQNDFFVSQELRIFVDLKKVVKRDAWVAACIKKMSDEIQ